MTEESELAARQNAEEFESRHARIFHEIQVKAFELWEEAITSGSVDYGPWFWWFFAEWNLGLGPEPLPPPIE